MIDRIEILTSGYVLNMIPTGSRDPYALRRAATGLIRIILDFRLPMDLLADSSIMHSLCINERPNLARSEMLHASFGIT